MAGRRKAARKTARRAKPRKNENVTEAESMQLLADITRIANAWEKHAPNTKFAGMTVEEFRKAVQPSFDAHAEVALLEWKLAQLRKALEEEGAAGPKSN